MRFNTPRRLLAAALLAACSLPAYAETPEIMVVTSDPQYPWSAEADRGGHTDDAVAEALVREQYESIASFRRAHPLQRIPVIINGDLTSNGVIFQHQKIQELFGILGQHYYFGLGNHDYENNLNDGNKACLLAYCATDSLNILSRHVTGMGDAVVDFDLRSRAESGKVIKEGSWSYAFKAVGWKHSVNLQVNNSPDYAVDLSTFSGFLQPTLYRITPSVDWLLETSRKAIERGARFTFIHSHKPNAWYTSWSDPSSSLAARAARAGAKAIFAGHYHEDMGVQRVMTGMGGSIPLFISGSASQRTYLIVEHWPESRKIKVYGVRNNDPSTRELLEEIDA
jgi:Calcineurin-like phosphoesterase.